MSTATDFSLALVHLSSGGREGHGPHLVADVLRQLQSRGHKASVHQLRMMGYTPEAFAMTVNEKSVDVRRIEGSWHYSANLGSIRCTFDPLRSMKVPRPLYDRKGRMVTVDDFLSGSITSWTKQWPTVMDDCLSAYASRITGTRVTTSEPELRTYMSPAAMADAIESLVVHAPCMPSKGTALW